MVHLNSYIWCSDDGWNRLPWWELKPIKLSLHSIGCKRDTSRAASKRLSLIPFNMTYSMKTDWDPPLGKKDAKDAKSTRKGHLHDQQYVTLDVLSTSKPAVFIPVKLYWLKSWNKAFELACWALQFSVWKAWVERISPHTFSLHS